uniref:Uncharacterized protein n=1 Tax=Peronospora matthiolae TaxID=2874970 RepID=A0AAV1TEN1_9STRA
MELSSAAGALRTLKNRPKVPQSAVDTAQAILHILLPSDPVSVCTDEATRREGLQQELQTLLLYGRERWEPLAVFFVVVRDILETPHVVSTTLSETFVTQTIKHAVHQYLEYYEPRVRMAIATLLGVLAKWDLAWVSHTFLPQLVDSIEANLSRSPEFEDTGFDEMDDNISTNGMTTPPLSPSGQETTPRTPSTPYRLDDVSGWKALESSLCALKYIIKASGQAFLEKTRHKSETRGTILADIAPVGFLEAHRPTVSDILNKCIKRGLEDNWCQVRYAASIAARMFLLKLQDQGRKAYLPILLPRLCLNRYYIAERVQKYSQESWTMIVGTHGRELVATYANEIVDYYVEMTSHCVRESACQCIAELGMKVDPTAIRPHVGRLMQALLICFYDVSNLVRDAACLASAQLVLGFPEECRPFLEELYRLWIDHLSDYVWSVREDAAIALGNVIRAYGKEALDRVVDVTQEYLPLAEKQPAMTQLEYDELMRSEKKHLSKQAFSCCSLEPKLFERHEHREKEPWEYTDGAIYMVRELCSVAPDVAVKYLPQVADIAILRHFPQTAVLQETIWKQLPVMCETLGKKVFKRYLELFFDPLVFTLQGTNRLATFAARDCVAQISKQIGPSIFLGRLDANAAWKEVLGPVVPVQPYMMK